MLKLYNIYLITFILAFSSIVYELLLGQSLSAFLGNTVLRYSVTVGLYLFAMGIGAFIAQKFFTPTKNSVLALLAIEIALVLLGGGSIMLLHMVYSLNSSVILFSTFAHTIIIVIGILTGLEIPLLINIYNQKRKNGENIILGVNYLGALFGSVLFAFLFYPKIGLVGTAFSVALLNTLAGLMLFAQNNITRPDKRLYYSMLSLLVILGIILLVGLVYSETINEYLIGVYLGI